MTEKYLLTIFAVFIFSMNSIAALEIYLTKTRISHRTQVPSSPVLDVTHAKEDMRILCGPASPFIPEFCADKLGRSTNSIPALLMKR